MTDLCPTCRQQLPVTNDLIIDEGIVVCNGRVAALTRQQLALLEILVAAKGHVRSRERLLHGLYALTPDDAPEITIVNVQICHLRRKLSPLGVEIQTVWAEGYRLIPITERKPS